METQNDLQAQVEELSDFIENSSIALHRVDATGRILWANQAELDLLGYSRDEYIGHSIGEFHVDSGAISDILTRLAHNKTLVNYEARLRCKDGRVKDVLINSNAYIKDGRFIHTRCFTSDITEFKKAQQRIRRSEKLFRSIALNIPKSLIIVIDKEHRFIIVEGDMMTRMGYDIKNYEGKHPTEVGPAERYYETRHLYDRVLKGEKFSVEHKSETGDDFLVHFVPLRNSNDEVEAGLIIALNVTDVKQAEEKVAKLAAIVESSDDAIISKTLEGIVTSWNDSAERMFGYSADEMVGQSIFKIIPEERRNEETSIFKRLKKGERVHHFETERLTRGMKLLPVSITVSPIKDSRGNIIGLSKIARDITDKKREEARKNDFIAMVSHELKTPLTSISSYIQFLLIKAEGDGDESKAKILTRAELQTRKMGKMIQDFLTMARIGESKFRISKQNFNLKPVFDEVVHEAQLLTSSHRITVDDCDMKVHADKDKISQVIVNLINNAIKYSPEGGDIVVGCEKKSRKVRVYVKDEGVGITKKDQKNLFDRFYRVENEKIQNVAGFGIGLYLVAEILKYHNSKIQVESTEGEGSVFCFLLDTAKEEK